MLALFAGNLLHGCLDVKNRLLFLFLHAGIFLFLLTRPIFGELDPNRDWFLWTVETTMFALSSIYVSMLFLLLGSTLCSAIARHNECARERKARMAPRVVEAAKPVNNVVADYALRIGRSEKMLYIRRASFLLFIVCFAGAMYDGSIRLSYMGGMSYEEYYLIDSSEHIPWIVDLFRAMTPYVLCAYLATMPCKRPTAICFLMFIATSVPILLIGSRGDFVIDILFAALYFVFRSITDKEERWITKRMMVGVAILAPLGIFAMGLQNYLRSGQVTNLGFVEMLEDALFKQGVTFTVLGRAYLVNDQVQDLGFKFFTMGAFISNITEGFIGQTFWLRGARFDEQREARPRGQFLFRIRCRTLPTTTTWAEKAMALPISWNGSPTSAGEASPLAALRMACAFYLLSRSDWQKVVLGAWSV